MDSTSIENSMTSPNEPSISNNDLSFHTQRRDSRQENTHTAMHSFSSTMLKDNLFDNQFTIITNDLSPTTPINNHPHDTEHDALIDDDRDEYNEYLYLLKNLNQPLALEPFEESSGMQNDEFPLNLLDLDTHKRGGDDIEEQAIEEEEGLGGVGTVDQFVSPITSYNRRFSEVVYANTSELFNTASMDLFSNNFHDTPNVIPNSMFKNYNFSMASSSKRRDHNHHKHSASTSYIEMVNSHTPMLGAMISPTSPVSSPSTTPTPTNKFINPSLMLSENASHAAKLATNGSVEDPCKALDAGATPTTSLSIKPNFLTPITTSGGGGGGGGGAAAAAAAAAAISTNTTTTTNNKTGSMGIGMSMFNINNDTISPNRIRKKSSSSPCTTPSSTTSSVTNMNLNVTSTNLTSLSFAKNKPIMNAIPTITTHPTTLSKKARRKSASVTHMTINNSTSTSNTNGTSLNEEVKPFKCGQCEKAFRRSEHLKRHVRSVHSSERPFPCTFCDKRFSRSDNLSQHLKTHKKHGDF
ncbi:hypothetical protein TBLA_0G01920 [Henningerozyma blattae CBS 6284]|uniref:C2H2-type domain-containing protein n=1 Tax=Henningerozyma blattae (strain ATCC 34711 / CBS 6284 / DSM 70876 / NBRC 10599 / NRRL Y-10934 / UCD 77-7) TaxID=1071380 RepID=I2H6Y2_HENB6|nr:hypothetical protein TBLA_0G01920 [Tetrapisispora blattae CBS 6284]CCH62134.1 hypothetical protein TBLA_0G01920 [Tetrapisispora blattae CBS 6284]